MALGGGMLAGVDSIGLAGAFLGGMLAILSPCAAMLLPAFFAYAFGAKGRLASRTLVFLAGLLTTLVPLGWGAAAVGAFFVAQRGLLIAVAAGLVILLGFLQSVGRSPQLPGRSGRPLDTAPAAYVLGLSYGVAGTCTGPILGSLLAYAAASADPGFGALLFAVFGVGMAVPLFVLAALWDRLRLGGATWLRPRALQLGPVRTTVAELVSGLLLIGLGVLLLVTEGTASLGGILSPAQQLAVEAWAGELGGRVPDLVVVVLAAGLAVGLAVRASRRDRAHEE